MTSWGSAMGAAVYFSPSGSQYLFSYLFSFFLFKINFYWSVVAFRLHRWLSGKESACSAGDLCSIPESGRTPGEGNYNPLQGSCVLAWRIPLTEKSGRLHGVAESDMTERLKTIVALECCISFLLCFRVNQIIYIFVQIASLFPVFFPFRSPTDR